MLNLNCELKKQDFGEYTYISYLQKDGLIKKLGDEGIKILKLSDKDAKTDEVSPGYLVPTKDLLDYFNKIIQIEGLGLYPIIETLLDKFKSKGANFFVNTCHEKVVCTISKGDYIVRFQDDIGNLASIFLTGEFDLHYEGNLSRLLNIGNYFYNLFDENFSSEIKYKLLVSLIDKFKSVRDEFLQVRAELTSEELSKASEIWPYVTIKMENDKLISIKYYNVDIPILSSFVSPNSPIDITDRNSLSCDIKNLTLARLALSKAIELYSKLIKVR